KKIKNLPYSLFLGEERFRLYIEALYRGDKEEVNYLVQTAPYGAHRIKQTDFSIYRTLGDEMVNSLRLTLDPRLVELRMIQEFQKVLGGLSKKCIRGERRLRRGPRSRLQAHLASCRKDRRPTVV
ncbi:MAG: hypothetical protein JOZ19_07175, partial [Rubrobacter sp.]|nr:hypothetical protein [Rubrobacter sp.]